MALIWRSWQNLFDSHVGSEFKNEIQALSQIEHLNLVRFLGYVEHGDERIILVEHVANGSLREHLDGECISLPGLAWLTAPLFPTPAGLLPLGQSACEILHTRQCPCPGRSLWGSSDERRCVQQVPAGRGSKWGRGLISPSTSLMQSRICTCTQVTLLSFLRRSGAPD